MAGASFRAFSEKSNISPSGLQQYVNGESEPTRPVLISMAKAAGVEIAWLVCGIGPKEKGGAWITDDNGQIYQIPEYDVHLSADEAPNPRSGRIIGSRPFRDREISAISDHPENLLVLKVRGESMYPTFHPGDEVLVDISEPIPREDGIFVIRQDRTLIIKRVQHFPGGRLKILSDNPAYEDFEIDSGSASEGFALIGRVIWASRRY